MKVKFSFIFFTFCMLFGISAIQLFAQADNKITGFIRSPERQAVSDLYIELYNTEFNRSIGRVKTDSGGRYIFTGLAVGRYELHLITVGTNYQDEVREVEIQPSSYTTTGGVDTVQANFNLRYRSGATPDPAKNGVLFAQEIPPNAKKAYEAGVSDLKDKKTDAGITELKSAVQIFPKYYLALQKLGEEYIAQQKYQEAAEVLAKAVEVNPKSFESQYALGYSLYQRKDYPHAVEALKKAIELNSSSVNALFLLGTNQRMTGSYQESLANLLKAEKLASPPQSKIHMQLSLLYTNNLKNYNEAANELETFLKLEPGYQDAESLRQLVKTLRAKPKS